MKLLLDGKPYEVPRDKQESLVRNLLSHAEEEYGRIPAGYRIIAQGLSRMVLASIEEKVTRGQGKEAGRAMRPPRGADPNLWLIQLIAPMLVEGLEHVGLAIATDQGSVTALALVLDGPGASGGFLDSAGNAGIRQDDRAQVS